jgi:GNAT superfamily N-acetyltransferase
MTPAPDILTRHLAQWLGDWPPHSNGGLTVVGAEIRTQPTWDGSIRDFLGVTTPSGGVLSVAPQAASALSALIGGTDIDADMQALQANQNTIADILGRTGQLGAGFFRWSVDPTPGDNVGQWIATDDDKVPAWLRPFNDEVLIEWDEEGRYGAGVGLKKHDDFGHEISVGTEESLRGRGIARRLVATAARRIVSEGRVATYLHGPDNDASGRVADAAGFPDHGWRVIGFWGP